MSKDKKKKPGIIETMREIDKKEAIERQERLERENEKRRKEFGQKNAEEKIEVLKIKQGIEDDYAILADNEEEKHYTFSQKVGNFIYHNKWWLILAVFMAFIVGFLVYDTLTTVRSDIRVMMISDDDDLQVKINEIEKLFNDVVEDYNDDDRNKTDMIFIPISHNMEDNMNSAVGYENSLTNLSTQFQLNECMLVIGDSAADELIMPDYSFEDLTVYFPDDRNIKDNKLYLKNTNFAKMLGLKESDLPDDLYLAVRKVLPNLSNEDTSKTNHDRAVATFKRVVRSIEN